MKIELKISELLKYFKDTLSPRFELIICSFESDKKRRPHILRHLFLSIGLRMILAF